MIEGLNLRSGLSRAVLYETPMMVDPREIREELEGVDFYGRLLRDTPELAESIAVKLERLKDIRPTIVALQCGQVLDDIQLFEIKGLALLSEEIEESLQRMGDGKDNSQLCSGSLRAVVARLDPDRNRIPHFYIYDSYSPELAALRRKLKATPDDEAVFAQIEGLEETIRVELCRELRLYSGSLSAASAALAHLDILLAKARQAIEMGLCKPSIGGSAFEYTGLFNPEIRAVLRVGGKEFQPVDMAIGQGPVLVTGANMTGKSVILKTVALTQVLAQFGFYVPAREAGVAVVEEILVSMGDDQDALGGLSSFAAEMKRIDLIVKQVRAGKRVLALVDEPARTTNPEEGRAIVSALVEWLRENHVPALVTTHYSGIDGAKKLRVKGFVDGGRSVDDLEDTIDYSLTEDNGEVPHEAIRIARMIGVDEALLRKAEEKIKNEKS